MLDKRQRSNWSKNQYRCGMAGLILLAALAALIGLLVWLSGLITRRLPLSSNSKTWLRVAIVVGAFPLMLIDEIVGKYQFQALCKANGIESADVSKARGKNVRLEISENTKLQGLMTPGIVDDRFYRDIDTNEILIHHKSYYSYGGLIMRLTPLSMGSSHPMLFPGGCGAESTIIDSIFRANNILIIN